MEVTGSEHPEDLLVHGEDEDLAGPATWLRGHPRWAVGLGLLGVVGVVLAAGWYVRAGPRLPTLVTASQPPGAVADLAVGPWTSGADGRPTGPPQVTMEAQVLFEHVPPTGSEVLGMDGPGLLRSTSSIRRVEPTQPQVTLRLNASLDCSAVPLPVRPGSYRLRMRVVDGSRTTEGTLAADQLGQDWASAVDQACGSWLVRRDLLVTAVTGTTDPVRPRASVTLAITNLARFPATLVDEEPRPNIISVSRTPAGPLRLPPGGTTQVRTEVDLARCDAVPSPVDTSIPGASPVDTGVLGVAATFGTVPPAATAQPWFDGTGPTGMLFTQAAGDTLLALLQQACGDVNAVVPLIAPGGVHVDPDTKVMTVKLLLDMAPGKVTDLQLVSDPYLPDQASFTPLWVRTSSLVPDSSGQASVTLAYRAPAGGCGPASGAWLPGVTAVAHVPGPAGVRTLSYSLAVDLWENPQAIEQLCPGGTR